MKNFIKAMDKLPFWAKIILALPALDIIWNVYRLLRSCVKKNVLGIILAIILIIPGALVMWLIDIICIVAFKNVLWID